MYINLNELIPTQNSIRDSEKLKELINKFDNNIFSLDVNKPKISKVDNKYYIHDGHTRLVAYYLWYENNKFDLSIYTSNSLNIATRSYEDYCSINFAVGYVTPFYLGTECRKPDFFGFKDSVMGLYRVSYLDAIQYIIDNRNDYREPRKIFSLQQLAEKYENAI